MGLFKKKKKKEETPKSNVLLAMPMFNNGETFDLEKVIAYLLSDWGIEATDINGSSETVSFSVQGETVVLGTIAAQIPWGDIQGAAQYAYNWPTAEADLEDHNSHLIVTILSNNTNHKERFGILTKVLTAILATSNCIGVYQGSQSLLIPKEQYLDSAEALKSDLVPLDLWVYIGVRKGEQGNSAYSYGLTTFDKLEMEFVNAPLELRELYTYLNEICGYVIKSNVTFKSGETLGFTAEQKIKIVQSKGVFVEGESFKFEL
ncbi:DUF4261 domain-containing protein [Chryseobacterium vaccae]|uniref:DUF4261 domain-containing protein n=1 Tax=Chryseobacterium vaccae TaxID=2604424 RepID=UPI001295AC41|nr:DUF4261 domain-containing protein [Chryseobacterium vaccae]